MRDYGWGFGVEGLGPVTAAHVSTSSSFLRRRSSQVEGVGSEVWLASADPRAQALGFGGGIK